MTLTLRLTSNPIADDDIADVPAMSQISGYPDAMWQVVRIGMFARQAARDLRGTVRRARFTASWRSVIGTPSPSCRTARSI